MTFVFPDPAYFFLLPTPTGDGVTQAGSLRGRGFSVCVELPAVVPKGDQQSMKECRQVGSSPRPYGVVMLSAINVVQGRVPAATPRGLGHVVRRWTRYGKDDPGLPSGQEFAAPVGRWGLQVHYPRSARPGIHEKTLLWHGADVYHVGTMIECVGIAPGQQSKGKSCLHSFNLAPDPTQGELIRVAIRYNGAYLPQWNQIESETRRMLTQLSRTTAAVGRGG